MIANTKTLTNINNFYNFLNSDPLSFNGLYLSCTPSVDSICGDDEIWLQYAMPLSREKLAQVIKQAEDAVATELGTFVGLKWISEIIDIPTNFFYNRSNGRPLNEITFKTKYKFVRRFGQQKNEKITTVTLTYHDDDGDGFSEYATASFTLPSGKNLCDTKLFYKDTNHELGLANTTDFNEITRLVSLKIDGWLLVKPNLYLTRSNTAFDGCDESNFVTEIDIYNDGVDSEKPQAELFYDTTTCNAGCDESSVTACVKLIDGCNGIFSISPDTTFCGRATKVKVYYQAGCFDCEDNAFCSTLENIVFKLAASYLPYPTCDCKCVQSVLMTMQQQTSLFVKAEGRAFNFPSWYKENSIFGTTVGAIEAAIDLLRVKEIFCQYE